MPAAGSVSPWVPQVIDVLSNYSVGPELRVSLGGTITYTTNAWPTANLAIYIPFMLPFYYPVARLGWQNGTAGGGNWDVGIYSSDNALVVSTGSTAATVSSNPQWVALSPVILLPPGRYYWGVSHSATTVNHADGTVSVSALKLNGRGVYQEASALPLPTAMTPVSAANAWLPLVGMSCVASGF